MTTTRSATDQVAADDNNVHTVLRSLDPYKFDPGSDDVANAASLNQLLTMLALCFPCLQDPSNQRQLRKQTNIPNESPRAIPVTDQAIPDNIESLVKQSTTQPTKIPASRPEPYPPPTKLHPTTSSR